MSLGIAFKGPEGIVLAADSRVTLTAQVPAQNLILPATFDNATKLLKVAGQDFVGVVTYGLGAIGQQSPRTAHSFVPEFETSLGGVGRLPIPEFAQRLSDFFLAQWQASMPAVWPAGNDMVFLIGGYDADAPYGRLFEVAIPSGPVPAERHQGDAVFGMMWGGQREYVDRLIQGYDPNLPAVVKDSLGLNDAQVHDVVEHLKVLNLPAPYQFLPLQDCVDLCVFFIRTTMVLQSFLVALRGVGGAIDVATITRTEGFTPVQQKHIQGERT